MIIISHRKNTVIELESTSQKYGVEVDIRSQGDELIIHHDPFKSGESFELWLDAYKHRTLILNVKEEGLEQRLIQLLQARGITDYFFLDQSFPFLLKWAKLGEKRCAVRISEFESYQTALSLAGYINWVWVDCFTHFALKYEEFIKLKHAGFKLCIVSPELQGRSAEQEIPALRKLLFERDINVDAVCTKRPDLWEG